MAWVTWIISLDSDAKKGHPKGGLSFCTPGSAGGTIAAESIMNHIGRLTVPLLRKPLSVIEVA